MAWHRPAAAAGTVLVTGLAIASFAIASSGDPVGTLVKSAVLIVIALAVVVVALRQVIRWLWRHATSEPAVSPPKAQEHTSHSHQAR
ncbi:MAG: hypothetical protein ACLGIA_12155 [Actinomycetes bacterium]